MTIETCPICGGDLMNFEIATYPPIPAKQCNRCGWRWEGEREQIVRVPFAGGGFDIVPAACRGCSNHPSNGGSGICSCMLGGIVVT